MRESSESVGGDGQVAISAAAPASRAALSMYNTTSGHVTVTSQHNQFCHSAKEQCDAVRMENGMVTGLTTSHYIT